LQVLDKRKELELGTDNPDAYCVMHGLAAIYYSQGRLTKSEELYLQVLEGMKTKQGPNHPDTLAIMNDLAVIYSSQGKLKEAEQL